MNIYELMNPGHTTQFELWRLICAVSLLMSVCMLVFALTVDHGRRYDLGRPPLWFAAVNILGMLALYGIPYNIVVLVSLLLSMSSLGAPTSAIVMSAIVYAVAWGLSFRLMFLTCSPQKSIG